MKKKNIVRSNVEFNNIINNGLYKKNRYYVIYYILKDEEQPKFGIAVGTKVGKAVTRNKIKRQIRKIVDNNIKMFKNNRNYIIICKKEILDIKYSQMEQELISLIKKGDKYEKENI